MSVRKKRISEADRERTLANLGALDIHIDPHTDDNAWSETLRISSQHGLTAYDACYVALAETLDVALMTADARLSNAPGTRCSFLLV